MRFEDFVKHADALGILDKEHVLALRM